MTIMDLVLEEGVVLKEVRSHELPTHPFERIGLDVFEIKIYDGLRCFLIETDELNNLTPKTTILACKRNERFMKPCVPEPAMSTEARLDDSEVVQQTAESSGQPTSG
ncbi:hypothetical protein J6590_022930 [Homalodisca vitripennis]|nr:hypothetical protein J6590_022930 [Homalodisca vitripennis]